MKKIVWLLLYSCLTTIVGCSVWAQPNTPVYAVPPLLQLMQHADDWQVVWQGKTMLSLPANDMLCAYRTHTRVSDRMGSYRFRIKKEEKAAQTAQIAARQTSDNSYVLEGKLMQAPDETFFYLHIWLDTSQQQLHLRLSLSDTSYNLVELHMRRLPNEHFFGGGIQFSHLDVTDKYLPLWSEEDGVGRGDQPVNRLTHWLGAAGNDVTTHAAIPFFQSSEGRAVHLETNGAYSYVHFAEQPYATIGVLQPTWEAVMWKGTSPLHLIEQYTAFAGRAPLLPTWAYGWWLGVQGGTERVTNLYHALDQQGIAPSAIWIQDWVGKRATKFGSQLQWNWRVDTTQYHHLPEFCAAMRQRQVRVLGYINPFLVKGTALCDTALQHRWVVQNKHGKAYSIATTTRKAYLIDLSNPQACVWYKNIIKQSMIASGMSGWMSDYADWLPTDAVLYSGVSALNYHNQYATDWAKLNREAIAEAGKEGELLFFSRAGYSHTTQYATLMWLGDQLTTWGQNDGIQAALTGMLSGAMSGVALNHSDVGGYTNIKLPFMKCLRSRELLYRWLEMNTFMPVLRTHEGLQPQHNAQIYSDTATMQFARPLLDMHQRLQPYFEQLCQQAAQYGYPIVRPLYLHYPSDTQTYHLSTQYMLGSDLIIAPVLQPNTHTVRIYLPDNEWQHLYTQQSAGQGWQTVAAPLGQPAVFVRKGSALQKIILAK